MNRFIASFKNTPATILSLFPGAGLLDYAFQQEGFCVLRGPEILLGQDIRDFHPTQQFDGIIGGPPCQGFSSLKHRYKNSDDATIEGIAMIREFARCVVEAQPLWWLMENVPAVPSLKIEGYSWQRIDLTAVECGMDQYRLRHFQFGHAYGGILSITDRDTTRQATQATAVSDNRPLSELCHLQGLPRDFSMPAMRLEYVKKMVVNGVPIPMGRAIAKGIKNLLRSDARVCACTCGRVLTGNAGQRLATAACRKKMQMRSQGDNVIHYP